MILLKENNLVKTFHVHKTVNMYFDLIFKQVKLAFYLNKEMKRESQVTNFENIWSMKSEIFHGRYLKITDFQNNSCGFLQWLFTKSFLRQHVSVKKGNVPWVFSKSSRKTKNHDQYVLVSLTLRKDPLQMSKSVSNFLKIELYFFF